MSRLAGLRIRAQELLLSFSGRGMTAEAIALNAPLGLVLGVFPVFGCPTILCTVAALLLRLNLPAIQSVNYLAYPLQLTLLAPFIRLGSWFVHSAPRSPGNHGGLWQAAFGIWDAALGAVVAWFCVCLPAGMLLYFLLAAVLRRFTCASLGPPK